MYIKVNVTATDRPRYRMSKGEIEINVLAFCNTNGEFVFVLLVEMSTREMVAGAPSPFTSQENFPPLPVRKMNISTYQGGKDPQLILKFFEMRYHNLKD